MEERQQQRCGTQGLVSCVVREYGCTNSSQGNLSSDWERARRETGLRGGLGVGNGGIKRFLRLQCGFRTAQGLLRASRSLLLFQLLHSGSCPTQILMATHFSCEEITIVSLIYEHPYAARPSHPLYHLVLITTL